MKLFYLCTDLPRTYSSMYTDLEPYKSLVVRQWAFLWPRVSPASSETMRRWSSVKRLTCAQWKNGSGNTSLQNKVRYIWTKNCTALHVMFFSFMTMHAFNANTPHARARTHLHTHVVHGGNLIFQSVERKRCITTARFVPHHVPPNYRLRLNYFARCSTLVLAEPGFWQVFK